MKFYMLNIHGISKYNKPFKSGDSLTPNPIYSFKLHLNTHASSLKKSRENHED